MQGIPAERAVIHVSTINERVTISTNAYGDGLGSVGLYTTSNVVVGDGNAAVIYATGSFTAATLNGSLAGSKITGALPAGSISFSTITTQFNSVAADTTTLASSMVTQFAAVGTATTTIAASTTTLYASRASSGTNSDLRSLIALDFASSTLVYASSIASPGDLNIYTDDGERVARFSDDGEVMFGSTSGCFSSSISGTLDLCESIGGSLSLIRYDTSVSAGDDFGIIRWQDRDSSTGGETTKMVLVGEAAEGWSSDNSMEMRLRLRFARQGGTLYDGVVFTSSGTSFGRAGDGVDTSVSCDTCTLQVQGNASITQRLETSTGVITNKLDLLPGSTFFYASNYSYSGTSITVTNWVESDDYVLVHATAPLDARNGITYVVNLCSGSWIAEVEVYTVGATTGALVGTVSGNYDGRYDSNTNDLWSNGPDAFSGWGEWHFYPNNAFLDNAENASQTLNIKMQLNPLDPSNSFEAEWNGRMNDSGSPSPYWGAGNFDPPGAACTGLTSIRFWLWRWSDSASAVGKWRVALKRRRGM
jgi:hypothetical protein